MSDIMLKSRIPMIITTIIATLLVIDYFVEIEPIIAFRNEMTTWAVIIYSFATFLGSIIMLRHQGKKATTSKKVWDKFNGTVAVGSFLLFVLIALALGPKNTEYQTLYRATIFPMFSCIWGITFIYSGMAVYRAFRLTSLESIALFLCGTSIFLKEMPIVAAVFPAITPIGEWFITYAGGSTFRVGILSSALGAIIVGIRTIFWRERTSIG